MLNTIKKLIVLGGVGTLLAISCLPAQAGDEDVGLQIAGATGPRLAYFGDSDGKTKLGEWSRDQVAAMHLQIVASKGDFVQVNAGGKPVWLDRERVRVARKGADCVSVAMTGGAPQAVAGSRGASKEGGCL